jgi:hypothetical protein
MFSDAGIIFAKKFYLKKFIFIFFLTTSIISCAKIDLFEKQVALPSQQWFYNLYIILRHTDAYNYNNIWVQLGSKAPGDTMHFQNINLELATDANGWQGTGVDDIFEIRKNITPGPVPFKKPGEYTFSVAQIMRENPLNHILNVGFRVEKVK